MLAISIKQWVFVHKTPSITTERRVIFSITAKTDVETNNFVHVFGHTKSAGEGGGGGGLRDEYLTAVTEKTLFSASTRISLCPKLITMEDHYL